METKAQPKFGLIDLAVVLLVMALVAFAALKLTTPNPLLGHIPRITVEVVMTKATLVSFIKPGDPLFHPRFKQGRQPFATIGKVVALTPLPIANMNNADRMGGSATSGKLISSVEIVFVSPLEVYSDKMILPGTNLRVEAQVGKKFDLRNYRISLVGEIVAQQFESITSVAP
jgi:hypothetical protein